MRRRRPLVSLSLSLLAGCALPSTSAPEPTDDGSAPAGTPTATTTDTAPTSPSSTATPAVETSGLTTVRPDGNRLAGGTRDGLVALRVDGEAVERSTVIPLGGTLTSNLAALDGEGSVETPTLAAGTENGLRLWIPS